MQALTLNPAWTFTMLAVIMTTKHYVADFLLQTTWMALGKEKERDWFLPLLAHVSCHAGLTLVLALALAPRLWWLAPLDFVLHFSIDRGKALLGHAGQWTARDEKYWWLLGFDQYLHQITNVVFAAILFVG